MALPALRRASLFSRLASIAFHHKWKVVAGWGILLVAIFALARVASGSYATRFSIPGSESQRAMNLLTERFPARSGSTAQIVFHTAPAGPALADPAIAARISAILAEARSLPDVGAVSPPSATTTSADGHTAFATVQYAVESRMLPRASVSALVGMVERANSADLTVEGGGQVVARMEQSGFASSEAIGVTAAAVILLFAFGSVVAMGLPILLALVSLGGSLSLIGLSARLFDMTAFTPAFAAMIGLGVGIDYALLVVTRFREGLHSGHTVEEATRVAMETAGRSVLFAGTIVIIAMLGLMAIGIPFIGAIGVAAAIVVALSVVGALTLLPAVLAILGKRVDALSIPFFRTTEGNHEASVWFRLSHAIQRRPLWFAAGAAILLGALAVPFLSMETAFGDASTNPPTSHTRRAYDLLSGAFGAGFNGPLTVVVDTRSGGRDAIPALQAALAAAPDVVRVAEPATNQAGDTAVISVYPRSAPQAAETNKLVHDLRDRVIPGAAAGTGLTAYVSGPTAGTIDVSDRIASRTPIFFAVVIGLSVVVLTCVFRSLLIPLKAALMNLLSIGAAYGVLVAIFQWGWFEGLLGIHQTGPIEPFLPMMMFAILFGLSMDYEVFLVSRIREEYIGGMETSRAVAYGLASTARVITSAALIMMAVFFSFVLGGDRVIKEFGLGLATAVFLDATMVRLILVPSLMELFGRANWWLPSSLDRVLPRIHLDAPIEVPVSALAALPANADKA